LVQLPSLKAAALAKLPAPPTARTRVSSSAIRASRSSIPRRSLMPVPPRSTEQRPVAAHPAVNPLVQPSSASKSYGTASRGRLGGPSAPGWSSTSTSPKPPQHSHCVQLAVQPTVQPYEQLLSLKPEPSGDIRISRNWISSSAMRASSRFIEGRRAMCFVPRSLAACRRTQCSHGCSRRCNRRCSRTCHPGRRQCSRECSRECGRP
jgi:hypothetical protein